VGGTTAAPGNTIAKTQGAGLVVASVVPNDPTTSVTPGSGFVIQGNLIGTNASGAGGMGNSGHGIDFTGSNSQIGGPGSAANVIGGNSLFGISGSGNSNKIQGNYVGTDTSWTVKRANAFGGISWNGTSNTIGGSIAQALGNTVSGNTGSGLTLGG